MRRVLFFVREYPQISETYIRTEIDRVKRHFAAALPPRREIRRRPANRAAVPALVPTATDGYRAAMTT